MTRITQCLLGVLLTLAAVTTTAPAHAAPSDAITSATYGRSEIWLAHKASDRKQRDLVFQSSPQSAPRVLDIVVPPRETRLRSDWAENLTLGLDRRGRLTAVLQSRRGLYRTRVAGTPRLRHVPGTTRADVFPALFRGTVAYNHIVGERGSAVRLRPLGGGRARTVWSNRTDPSRTWVALQIAVGTRGSVAIVTARDGAGNGAYRALLARPGRATRRLHTLGLGHDHTGGLGAEISSSGRRLRVTREFDAATTTLSYALPSGKVASPAGRRLR